ncbi:MAG: ChaN family lipoprotein [Oceanospirillaceae bacterium]|nr:ChaN family lipoprotein [Oceanospirillaceae bacterium]
MPASRSGMHTALTRTAALSLLGLCLATMPARADDTVAPARPGEILDLQSGETLSPGDLYERLNRRKLILIGEQHDNPEHHAVESLLLEELITPGTHAVLEMLGPELPLDELSVTSSRDELESALRSGTEGWDWDSYGRIYYQILQQGGKLVSGNLGREQIQAIYEGGDAQLSQREQESVAAIGSDIRGRIGAEIREQHCNAIAADKLDSMVEIQLARDARMASQLDRYLGIKPAILLAGSYHARKDLGVPQHLKSDDSAVILLVPVNDSGELPENETALSPKLADYIWFTSSGLERDYCAGAASDAEAAATQ